MLGFVNKPFVLHYPINCPFTWYMNFSGIAEFQCFIHTPAAICIITLVFLYDLPHLVCKLFIFVRFISVYEIFIECLSAHFKYSAIYRHFTFKLAVISL